MNETQMQHGQHWNGEDLTGWIVSEKLDGVRAYWDGAVMWSRSGREIPLPLEWRAALPAGVALDGEIYDGIDGLSRCSTAARLGRFTDSMRFRVFDAPAIAATYLNRLATADIALAGNPIASTISAVCVRSTARAMTLASQIIAAGGEGLIARNPGITTKAGRTASLLKIKTEELEAWSAHL